MDTAQQDNTQDNIFTKLSNQLKQKNLPPDLAEKLTLKIERLQKISGTGLEADKELQYLEFVLSLPFGTFSQDILDIKRTAQILDKNHYGLKVVKDRILEYLSMLILNTKNGQNLNAPVLAFVGLVGSGKTSLASSIAESLGRKLIRIPLGGLGSTIELRGQSKTRAEAEPGRIMKQIQNVEVCNPVILLDEIDRVATESRADVMGVLVELLDPEQNWSYLDYYVDFPYDLSKVLFIATANNTGNIATAVMDRLEVIEMPSYTDEEKIMIGKNFILPKAIKGAGLSDNIINIDEVVWPQIVRPLGFDGGIRSLQRTVQSMVRKIAREVVEGKQGPYQVSNANMNQYIN